MISVFKSASVILAAAGCLLPLTTAAMDWESSIPSNDRAPLLGKRTIGGMTYPTITYFRQTGGTPTTSNPHLTSDFIYTVETSEDLVRWRIKPADLAHLESFSIFGVGYATPPCAYRFTGLLSIKTEEFREIKPQIDGDEHR